MTAVGMMMAMLAWKHLWWLHSTGRKVLLLQHIIRLPILLPSISLGVAPLPHFPHTSMFIIWSASRRKMERTGDIAGGGFTMWRQVLCHRGRPSTRGFHQSVQNIRAPWWLHVCYVVSLYWSGLLLFVHLVVFNRSLLLYTDQSVEL